MNGWYVLYVRYRHEQKVHSLLSKYKIESFLPRAKVLRQRNDRKKPMHRLLFPCYVFIRIYNVREFYKSLSIEGVVRGLKTGKNYTEVPLHEINRIKLLTAGKKALNVEVVDKVPEVGSLITIKNGPLTGITCMIENNRNPNNVIVSITSLRSYIRATIPNNYL